jgi:hypothetical protein
MGSIGSVYQQQWSYCAEENMTSLAAHISFYFVEERLPNLKKVVEGILSYKQFCHKQVWIHSNKTFDLGFENVSIVEHDCSKMIHPWHLTWAHRPLLNSQVGEYDVFMYNEDDIYVGQDNIDYWFEHEPITSSHGVDLGFIRIEVNSHGDECVVDLLHGEKHNRRYLIHQAPYSLLTKNYRGFWLYTKEQMKLFSTSQGFCSIPNYLNHCRENAARGMQKEDTPTVVPIVDGCLDSRSKVYHLTNNYCNDPKTPHGKVLFGDCI